MSIEYVNAIIQIPIKVIDDGSFEMMTEYMKIEIEDCIELPEKRNMVSIQMSLNEQVKNALEKKRLEKEKVFLPVKKSTKKRPQNITFKQYSSKKVASRNTAKYYSDDDTTQSESDSDQEENELEDKHSNPLNAEDKRSNPLNAEDKRSNPLNAEDKRSNPLNVVDKVVDPLQPQEVEELELADDQLHLNLREDEDPV